MVPNASFKGFMGRIKFETSVARRMKAFKKERRFRFKIQVHQAKQLIRNAREPNLKRMPVVIKSYARFRAWVQKKWPEYAMKPVENIEHKAKKYVDDLDDSEAYDDDYYTKLEKIPPKLAKHPLFYESIHVDNMDKVTLSKKLGCDWDAMMYLLERNMTFVDCMGEKLWRDKFFMFEAMHRAPGLMLIAYKKLYPKQYATSLNYKIVIPEHRRINFVFSTKAPVETSVLSDLCLCVPKLRKEIKLLPDEIIPVQLFQKKNKRIFEKKMRALEEDSTTINKTIKKEASEHRQWFDLGSVLKQGDEDEIERRFKEVEEMDAPPTPWLDFMNEYRHEGRMRLFMERYSELIN